MPQDLLTSGSVAQRLLPRDPHAATRPARSSIRERATPAPVDGWLTAALRDLASAAPESAGLVLLHLLPLQSTVTRDFGPLVVSVPRLGDFTTGRGPGPTSTVTLEPAALARIAFGGAPSAFSSRRRDGLRRGHVRQLQELARHPFGLGHLADAGVALPPHLLLRLVACAVDPAWAGLRPLTVGVAVPGGPEHDILDVRDGRTIVGRRAGLPFRASGVACAPAHLPGLLLARGDAAGSAIVSGDPEPLLTLQRWFTGLEAAPAPRP